MHVEKYIYILLAELSERIKRHARKEGKERLIWNKAITGRCSSFHRKHGKNFALEFSGTPLLFIRTTLPHTTQTYHHGFLAQMFAPASRATRVGVGRLPTHRAWTLSRMASCSGASLSFSIYQPTKLLWEVVVHFATAARARYSSQPSVMQHRYDCCAGRKLKDLKTWKRQHDRGEMETVEQRP